MLSDSAIRNAKPADKTFKLADEKGLFLLIAPSGGKWWRLKYRFGGKGKLLSLGTYPDVGLKAARDKRDEARKLLADGTDPGEHRKTTRAAAAEPSRARIQGRTLICWPTSGIANFPLPGRKPTQNTRGRDWSGMYYPG